MQVSGHKHQIATLFILLIVGICYLSTIQQPAYALSTFSGPKHYKENCSLPCNYDVSVNNYNFTIVYSIAQGNIDLPPDRFIMNVTSITIDTSSKTLIVNTTNALETNTWAQLGLAIPKNLLDAPAGGDNFHVYTDGKPVSNANPCKTGICVWDDTATPESHPTYNATFTTFQIKVNEPGNHTISIIGTQVAPELSFGNAILISSIVGLMGIVVILARTRFNALSFQK